jgi:RNA polymerase sigma factor (TIGR02999 family)
MREEWYDCDILGIVLNRSTTMIPSSADVTELLVAWSDGDKSAEKELFSLVYRELRRLAHRYMLRENPGNTLQTTALVNEAYLRLIDRKRANWQNRAHFFGFSAQVMRHILVDLARSKDYQKRGGQVQKLALDEGLVMFPMKDGFMVELDDALKALAEVDARKSKVVELRFFGGMSVEETAEVLKVSQDTVMRDWRLAKAWLWRALSKDRDK